MARLAKQILAILGSQIEIEQIFNIVGVFTSLRKCRLGVENLDSLVMIYKNWMNDVRVRCSLANEDVTKFFVVEVDVLESHEVELSEVEMFKEK